MLLPFLCPQPRYYYLVFYHSPDIIYFCLSPHIQSKTISGKEPCRICGQWTNESCGKNILLAHLMKMQIFVQLLFWVLIQDHGYPKLSRVFGWSSPCGKRAVFPCLALNLWPFMLQVSSWTEQAFEPAEVDSDPMCSSLAQAVFSASYTELLCGFFTQENKCPRFPRYFTFPCMPSYLVHTREKAGLNLIWFNPFGMGETSFSITHSRPDQENQKEEKGCCFLILFILSLLLEPLGIKDSISLENPGLVCTPFSSSLCSHITFRKTC